MSPGAEVKIVPAASADFPALRWLLLSARLPTGGVEPGAARFVVAHAGGDIVGCAGLEVYGRAGLLRSVVVHSAHRERGLGAALLGEVIALARRNELETLHLLTESAQRYFEGKGFEVVARAEAPKEIQQSWEFRLGCPSSAKVMGFARW